MNKWFAGCGNVKLFELQCEALRASQKDGIIQTTLFFLHVSNIHAPIQTARLKVRSNTWITREIVRLMYERDRVHKLAVQRKDDMLMENYRKLRNTITGMIKNRKREYFNEVSNSLHTSPH